MESKRFSQPISIFHGRTSPEEGILIGYGALIGSLKLAVPIPDRLAIISQKHKKYEIDNWLVFTPRYKPKDSIYGHLVFALKYEGINLLLFKKLFEKIDTKTIEKWITENPQSQYCRRIWFLYEWLMQVNLPIPDLKKGNYVMLVNNDLQYSCATSHNSSRHRIRNNLPGNIDFCPLISKTTKLEKYIAADLAIKTKALVSSFRQDVLLRASAFLFMKDSKASFTIEGETPTQIRAARWGNAIGQAGNRTLTRSEILRLQQIIIENSRFVQMGYRTEGGFVGEHDRATGEPIPEHISAKWEDIETLMIGLMDASYLMEVNGFHPVLTAAKIAFGFVFIHPLVDGNGRLHRYLIHHLLAKTKFTPQGIIFPVAAAMLEKIEDYRKVLETFSHPLLEIIEWKITSKNNMEVLNDTKDYYRYFDATLLAEFLYDCIDYTISKIIPMEVDYLQKFDLMKAFLFERFKMPDKLTTLTIRFLDQNSGSLSKRAKEKEFANLKNDEIEEIEQFYITVFENNSR